MLMNLYFSKNLRTYKIASGLLPTLLQHTPSANLLQVLKAVKGRI